MPAQPSPSAELASAFAFYDANRDGRLEGSEICTVLRAVGFCPTEAEARALATAAGSEPITLPELQLLVATLVVPRLSSDAAAAPAAVRSALGSFVELAGRGEGSSQAGPSACISLGDLSRALTKTGEPLSHLEFFTLLRHLRPVQHAEQQQPLRGALEGQEGREALLAPPPVRSKEEAIFFSELLSLLRPQPAGRR
jgi:Ca2+-binding EF-hand superfamily protein